MFSCNDSDRYLARVLAGLAITVTIMFGALTHAVVAAQPMV